MQRAQLERHRRDRDGVLEQAAEVGVVARPARAAPAAARRAAPAAAGSEHGARRISARSCAVAEQALEQRLQPRVIDLAREVLEEAFELVEVAVGGRQEAGRVGLDSPSARAIVRSVDLQLVAKALARARARARARRARSARRARRRRGTRARRSSRCCRAARPSGTGCPRARSGAPCACTRTRRRPPRSARSVATVCGVRRRRAAWRRPSTHDVRWFGCSP